MTTAGNLLFGSGGSGNFIAFDARVGKPFGHSQLRANPSNSAITYVMDGHQYILVAGGEDYYAFRLQD